MSERTALQDNDLLGRAIFDSKKAVEARKGKIHPRVFRERDNCRELSIDVLSETNRSALAVLHDGERPPQKFQGWAKVTGLIARDMKRSIYGCETLTNKWHGEIALPTPFTPDDQQEHALSLANKAVWEERPETAVP